jgi:hypothetical protein
MPDWEALVSKRLDTSGLTPEQRDEVVAELAGHFEEFYKEQRAKGYCESKAIERALSQVDDWPELARKISAAKRGEKSTEMRAKSFWLPGLFTVSVSIGWLQILQRANFESGIPRFQPVRLMIPFLLWVLTLPMLGAVGVYLSRLLRAERLIRLAAELFPPIAIFSLMFLQAMWHGFFERNGFIIRHPFHFVFVTFLWSSLPALGLLLGAVSFLKAPRTQVANA